MLGLKRGTVRLEPHQEAWETQAAETVECLRKLLEEAKQWKKEKP